MLTGPGLDKKIAGLLNLKLARRTRSCLEAHNYALASLQAAYADENNREESRDWLC